MDLEYKGTTKVKTFYVKIFSSVKESKKNIVSDIPGKRDERGNLTKWDICPWDKSDKMGDLFGNFMKE